MGICALSNRYWILIKQFILFFICFFVLLSCDQTQDTKGETIPALEEFSKVQNPVVTVSYLTKLLENQDGANLYFLRSKAYFDLRAYQKAEEDIEQALNKVPGDIDFLFLSAKIKSKLGLLDAAIEDAKLVESSGLASANLYLLLAELHFKLHEKRIALSYINKTQKAGIPLGEKVYFQYLARQVRSDSIGALESIAWKSIGHPDLAHAYFSFQIGRLANIQCQKYILGELKKYPLDPFLMMSWGDFLVHVSQFAQAEKVYNQVLLWLPRNPNIRIRMARFYLGLKKYDLADKQIDQINANYLMKDILYLRALIRFSAGQKEKSIALLDSAKKLYGSDARLTSLYDRIVGKKLDSTQVKVDSTAQSTP